MDTRPTIIRSVGREPLLSSADGRRQQPPNATANATNLAAALTSFTTHGVNVSYIQSSAAPPGSGAQVAFFIELAGHARDTAVAHALAELQPLAAFVKVLGSFACGAPDRDALLGAATSPSSMRG